MPLESLAAAERKTLDATGPARLWSRAASSPAPAPPPAPAPAPTLTPSQVPAGRNAAGADRGTGFGTLRAEPGLSSWAPALNQQLATAQQSQAYLEPLQDQLQALKNLLSRRLAQTDPAPADAGGESPSAGPGTAVLDAQIERRRARLEQLWQQRASASGGGLDAQLGFDATGQAPQRFSVRGLDARSLQTQGSETLAFSLPGARQQPAAVRVDPGLGPQAQAQRFDQALAPMGVRVSADARQGLVFQASPDQWERLSQGLMVKGQGKRFPTGQPVRVQLQPTPALIDPARWQLDSAEGLRQALPEVVRATRQVEQAQSRVQQSLASAGQALQAQSASGNAEAVQAFASRFATGFSRSGATAADAGGTSAPGYGGLAALVGSAQGLPRQRVERLLGPSD